MIEHLGVDCLRRAAEREFVLVPWLAIDPDAELAGHGRVADLLGRLRGSS